MATRTAFSNSVKWFLAVSMGLAGTGFLTPAQTLEQDDVGLASLATAGSAGSPPLAVSSSPAALDQQPSTEPPPTDQVYRNALAPSLAKQFAGDQWRIWTSPARVHFSDLDWLLPLGAGTGILFATDSELSRHLSNSPTVLRYSKDFSNYGIGAMAVATGGLYVWGHFAHDEHKRETGFLVGEAVANALAVSYVGKYAAGRERPVENNYRGEFLQGGSSFPSVHSTVAWAAASVFAHEYPGTLPKVLSYGLAAAISASRVSAKQHFASDVVVGGSIGFLVAEQVYRHHHDPELGGDEWPTYTESNDQGPGRRTGSVGSPYVELDSWIYPAIERLAALGYVHTEYLGIRPWTRAECALLVAEAGDQLRAADQESRSSGIAQQTYSELEREFGPQQDRDSEGAPDAGIESIYAQVTGINGAPLNDSDHFGQTIVDDYGRPYQQGMNTYDGFSAYANEGRFFAYVRGEFQGTPAGTPYSLAVRQAIAAADANPVEPAEAVLTVSQFRLLDTYFGANYGGWNATFGKQSLWWGTGAESSLMISNNAEPMYMFRLRPEQPFEVPLLSRVLGPFKTDFFVGKLSGNEFPARPAIHGENISFRPTKDLEIGFSRMVEFGGVGRPLTAGAIWNSYASTKSSVNYRAERSPGKRTSGFDFAYHVPFVRGGPTIYAETIAADDVVPLESSPRAAWFSGIYLPHFLVPRLELRVEGGYTDPVTSRSNGGQYIYWDLFYHDLSLNKANLIGSWLGREGKGVRTVATYSFAARSNIQIAYRQAKVAKDFIPNGETINDASIAVNGWLNDCLQLQASVQYEKWLAPVLAPGPETNWTSTVAITFWPRNWRVRPGNRSGPESSSIEGPEGAAHDQ